MAFEFVPYDELGDRPNVIVDGSATPSTRLTLSHWPGSPTPVAVQDDLSAQIAFHALERPDLLAGLDAVSNNHFDQDGLTSAFALVDPDAARQRRPALIDIARAGDFGTFEDRESIRVAFALAALDDPARSTLDPACFAGTYAEQCAHLYRELLPRLAEIVDHPDRLRPLWTQEDAHLGESLAAIADGAVTLTEEPTLDLAVVRVPERWATRATTRFAVARRTDAVHPAAVNRSTDCLRVVTSHGRTYQMELRYETWVMFRSRPVAPRPDLRLLAARLAEIDPDAGWRADAPGTLTPRLEHSAPESTLDEGRFLAEVQAFLATAAPAWDPDAPR